MKRRGFIDLHTHGIGRYDMRTGRAGDVLGIAALHGKAGAAGILPTVYPLGIRRMRMCMAAVRDAIRAGTPKGSAEVLGINLEGPFLNPLRSGALDTRYLLEPTLRNLRNVIDGFEDLIKVITIAPELKGALRVIERCRALGIRVNMGHSDATFRQALDGKKAGASGVTHLFNAMRGFHHREPGLAGFGLMDEDLYVEVIADGVHLAPEVLKMVFGVKKEDRIMIVSDSVKGPMLRRGVLQGGKSTVRDALKVLKGAGVDAGRIGLAAVDNSARYLGL